MRTIRSIAATAAAATILSLGAIVAVPAAPALAASSGATAGSSNIVFDNGPVDKQFPDDRATIAGERGGSTPENGRIAFIDMRLKGSGVDGATYQSQKSNVSSSEGASNPSIFDNWTSIDTSKVQMLSLTLKIQNLNSDRPTLLDGWTLQGPGAANGNSPVLAMGAPVVSWDKAGTSTAAVANATSEEVAFTGALGPLATMTLDIPLTIMNMDSAQRVTAADWDAETAPASFSAFSFGNHQFNDLTNGIMVGFTDLSAITCRPDTGLADTEGACGVSVLTSDSWLPANGWDGADPVVDPQGVPAKSGLVGGDPIDFADLLTSVTLPDGTVLDTPAAINAAIADGRVKATEPKRIADDRWSVTYTVGSVSRDVILLPPLYTSHVTYVLNGGTLDPAGPEDYDYLSQQPLTVGTPTKDGSTFTGWTFTGAGAGSLTTDAQGTQIPAGMFNGDITATANWTTDSGQKTEDPYRFIRYSGKYRMDTARIANEQHPAKGDIVFIATAYNFPDALSVAPAAAKNDAALFLVKPEDGIDAKTMADIKASPATQVYILGGKVAVPLTVENQLEAAGFDASAIHRLNGIDRTATSAMIAKEFFPDSTKAFLATGLNYPDALVGGSLAAHEDAPVMLVDPSKQTALSDLQKQALAKVTDVTALGGAQVMPDSFLAGFATTDRISGGPGGDRFNTAAAISAKHPADSKSVWVVTGRNYADALVASSIAGRNFEPVLLSERDKDTPATDEALKRFTEARTRYVAGGTVAILDGPAKVGLPADVESTVFSD